MNTVSREFEGWLLTASSRQFLIHGAMQVNYGPALGTLLQQPCRVGAEHVIITNVRRWVLVQAGWKCFGLDRLRVEGGWRDMDYANVRRLNLPVEPLHASLEGSEA